MLQERGHEPVLFTHGTFVDWIRSHDVPAESIGGDDLMRKTLEILSKHGMFSLKSANWMSGAKWGKGYMAMWHECVDKIQKVHKYNLAPRQQVTISLTFRYNQEINIFDLFFPIISSSSKHSRCC